MTRCGAAVVATALLLCLQTCSALTAPDQSPAPQSPLTSFLETQASTEAFSLCSQVFAKGACHYKSACPQGQKPVYLHKKRLCKGMALCCVPHLIDVSSYKLPLNVFRLTADALHALGMLALVYGLIRYKSASTVSIRSAELYGLVYICRYNDLFLYGVGRSPYLYNNVFKVGFVSLTLLIIVLVRLKAVNPLDSRANYFLLIPPLVLAITLPSDYSFSEHWWSFSMYLEAVALLPQVLLFRATKGAQAYVAFYIFALGIYRFLYVINWVYRYHTDPRYRARAIEHPRDLIITWTTGIVQVVLFWASMMYVVRRRMKDRQWVPDEGTPMVHYKTLPQTVEEEEDLLP